MLCGLGYGKARKPRVSRAKLSLNTRCSDAAPLSIRDAAIPAAPAGGCDERINRLAYTGSSPARCRPPPGAPAPLGQPSNALGRQNPSPFSHSICLQGRARKQAWPVPQPAATPTHLHNRARLQLQRCAASARAPSRPAPQTAPLRGQPRKEHRARRRRIHLQLT